MDIQMQDRQQDVPKIPNATEEALQMDIQFIIKDISTRTFADKTAGCEGAINGKCTLGKLQFVTGN
jgi:hypothetical protein